MAKDKTTAGSAEDEIVQAMDELREIVTALRAALVFAKEIGMPPKTRATLLRGAARMVSTLREIADDIEKLVAMDAAVFDATVPAGSTAKARR